MFVYNMSGRANSYSTLRLRRISLPIRNQMENGNSVLDGWCEIAAAWEAPELRKGDFTDCGNFQLAISEDAAAVLQPMLHDGCELLPVCDGERQLYLLYITTPDDPLVESASTFWGPDSPNRNSIRSPVFDTRVIGERDIFRVPGGVDYFVTYEMKKFIEDARLTGVGFTEAWTDDVNGFPAEVDAKPSAQISCDPGHAVVRITGNSKREKLLYRLWTQIIDRRGTLDWVSQIDTVDNVETPPCRTALFQSFRGLSQKGLTYESLTKWARGMAYEVVFSIFVEMDELRPYSRSTLFELWRSIDPYCWSDRGRRREVAEVLWNEVVEYFYTNTWWNQTVNATLPAKDSEFEFLNSPARVILESLHLGITDLEWRSAAHAFVSDVLIDVLKLIDELEAYGSTTLEYLHESLLTANPHVTN